MTSSNMTQRVQCKKEFDFECKTQPTWERAKCGFAVSMMSFSSQPLSRNSYLEVIQVIVQVDQELVNFPSQQTCFPQFYLCICQLCFITKTKLRNRKNRAVQWANQESPYDIVEQPDVRLSMDQFHFDRLEQKPGFIPRVQPAAQWGDQGLSSHNDI